MRGEKVMDAYEGAERLGTRVRVSHRLMNGTRQWHFWYGVRIVALELSAM